MCGAWYLVLVVGEKSLIAELEFLARQARLRKHLLLLIRFVIKEHLFDSRLNLN